MSEKRLITSALPYVNNVPHLGNLIQVLSADVYARYSRSAGYETLYVCGTDEYGTATETRALLEGVTPKELCDHYHKIHKDIYSWFNISFDHFGRTSSQEQTRIVQELFEKVKAKGYIREREIEQLYCPSCKRFLADRFVKGTCPHCHSEDARGDQCNNCNTLLDPTELVDPSCSVCNSRPEVRKTKHLYLDLPKALPLLEKWMKKASKDGFWANNAIAVTKSWIRDGLKERCITRDLKWGIPVPNYPGKVFYVWFDAPIGYISITSEAVKDYKYWWNDKKVKLYQFIGKDNIPFHTVIFPSTLLATDEEWTMLHHMSSSEYLNYEDGKFSKSNGVGIFGNDCQDTNIEADIWRFWIFYNRPEKSDVVFTWNDFEEKVNKQLVGNLSNLVNRCLTFIKKNYDNSILDEKIDKDIYKEYSTYIDEIKDLFEKVELREAIKRIFNLSDYANKVFQDAEPWKNKEESKSLLKTLIYLIKDISILLEPYMPNTSMKIRGFFDLDKLTFKDLKKTQGIKEIKEISYLFTRLDPNHIAQMKIKYSGKQEDRIKEKKMEENNEDIALNFAKLVKLVSAKIVNVEKHPNGDKLYILTLDAKEEDNRVIVSSIVPYYKEEELLNRNIIVVANLKSANFRGVKSHGMLLAASKEGDENHETCEVLFVDDIEPGSELKLEGLEDQYPEVKNQVKAEKFFSLPIYAKDGVVYVDGKKLASNSHLVKTHTYLNGEVG